VAKRFSMEPQQRICQHYKSKQERFGVAASAVRPSAFILRRMFGQFCALFAAGRR